MQQKLQQKRQIQAKEAKSFIKDKNGRTIKHKRQNVFKSHTNPENKTCHNFVILNKRKTFDKYFGKILKNVKEFGHKGFTFYCFYFILMFLFCILYYTYDQ